MIYYAVYTIDRNDDKLYLCPRGDNLSYVLKDTLKGAALWKTHRDVVNFMRYNLNNKPFFFEKIDMSNISSTRANTIEELNDMESGLNNH